MTLLIDFLLVIFTIIFVIFASLVIYARWNYGTLEATGIPVVKPHWLLGSNPNFMELFHHWEDVKRAKELGPIYGIYNGRTPVVFVNDPEMVRRVLLTDSDHFANKRSPDFGHPVMNEMLETLNGEKLKVIRSALTPLFTSGKIKQLLGIVEKRSEEYIGVLKKDVEANGGRLKVDLKAFSRPLVIEVIGECFGGIKLEHARDPNNSFVNSMKEVLWDDLQFDWTFNYTLVFPFLLKFLPSFPRDGLDFFSSTFRKAIDDREKTGYKIPDTINCLMEMRQKLNTPEYKRLGINESTIYAQAFEFFVAGYGGLITHFSDLSYHLANNPEANEKLMAEVDSALKKSNGKINHEVVSEMHYLAACISETLRVTTWFFRLDRMCTKDWEHDGYRINKGTEVIISTHVIHHNPDIYSEPEKFIPERFLPENKDKLPPAAFLTFGQGHRLCLGFKFVVEYFKILTVTLLKEFRVEKRSDTVWKEHAGNHMLVLRDPIYVDLVKR